MFYKTQIYVFVKYIVLSWQRFTNLKLNTLRHFLDWNFYIKYISRSHTKLFKINKFSSFTNRWNNKRLHETWITPIFWISFSLQPNNLKYCCCRLTLLFTNYRHVFCMPSFIICASNHSNVTLVNFDVMSPKHNENKPKSEYPMKRTW